MSHDENAFRTQFLHVSQKDSLANLFENSNRVLNPALYNPPKPELKLPLCTLLRMYFMYTETNADENPHTISHS